MHMHNSIPYPVRYHRQFQDFGNWFLNKKYGYIFKVKTST